MKVAIRKTINEIMKRLILWFRVDISIKKQERKVKEVD